MEYTDVSLEEPPLGFGRDTLTYCETKSLLLTGQEPNSTKDLCLFSSKILEARETLSELESKC